MRHNLALLHHTPANYAHLEHISLFETMKVNSRDHYHYREGFKDNMPFIALVKADLTSSDCFFTGHIGGRDDDRFRETELLDIKFSIRLNEKGKLQISIDSSDRITTYEQSIQIVLHSMNKMYVKRHMIGQGGGGGKGKKGFYPQSAAKKGRFSTFDKWFDKAEKELVFPQSMKESFLEMNYNLLYFKG